MSITPINPGASLPPVLAGMAPLSSLNLSATAVTDGGLAALRASRSAWLNRVVAPSAWRRDRSVSRTWQTSSLHRSLVITATRDRREEAPVLDLLNTIPFKTT